MSSDLLAQENDPGVDLLSAKNDLQIFISGHRHSRYVLLILAPAAAKIIKSIFDPHDTKSKAIRLNSSLRERPGSR